MFYGFRFSELFIEPIWNNITESVLDLSLQKVDTEYADRLQDDRWGIIQVEKLMSKREHPFRYCSIGTARELE